MTDLMIPYLKTDLMRPPLKTGLIFPSLNTGPVIPSLKTDLPIPTLEISSDGVPRTLTFRRLQGKDVITRKILTLTVCFFHVMSLSYSSYRQSSALSGQPVYQCMYTSMSYAVMTSWLKMSDDLFVERYVTWRYLVTNTLHTRVDGIHTARV